MFSLKRYFIPVIVLGALLALGSTPFIKVLDLKSTDLLARDHFPHPDIIILAVDTKSIAEIGRWPWPRTVHADVLNKLAAFSPRAVGIDINFSDPENEVRDAALVKAMDDAPFPIVLPVEKVEFASGSSTFLYPLERFRTAPNVTLGHVDATLAEDGTARLAPLPHEAPNGPLLPFTGRIAEALNVAPLGPGASYAINFAGPAGTFPTYSISDFLGDKIPRENLEDKVVLIGATASDLHDVIPVPNGNGVMAGVEWHANILDNILLARPFVTFSPFAVHLGGFLLALALALLFFRVRVRGAFLITLIALAAIPLISFLVAGKNILIPYFWNEIFILGAFAQYGVMEWYVAEKEKRRIKRTVQNYFSPAVLDMILKNPKALSLGGERREMSILFSDIRSFTTITESTDPDVLAKMLHEYFTEMTEEIFATDGVVDKFIGDAIMAFWGAPIDQPDHADRAVRAAQGMIRRLSGLQKKWQATGLPFVDIGVGIHTGFAIVGNMGSEKRFDYTAIGDTVNTASRLEGLNKEHKTHIIISEATKEKLLTPVSCAVLGDVMVKGKTVPVKIYSI